MGPRIFLHFAFVLPLLLAAAASSPSTMSIYDHLRLQGLPMGLLPKGISKYWINSTSGHFQVWLDQPCNAKFENQLHYDFNISGTLSYAQIAELSGLSAQELFLWFPVKGIRVDVPTSGLIHFDVGVVDKQFSLSLFESPPDCTVAHPDLLNYADPVQLPFKVNSGKLEHGTGETDVLKAVS